MSTETQTKKFTKTRILVECALMIALSTVLSMFPIYQMPQGGDVTFASMLPLIIISYRHNTKWGLFACFVHSLLQMLLGFQNVLYCPTLLAMIGCILLDYVLAFTACGLANAFKKPFKNEALGVCISTFAVMTIRYLCSFLSGILIWGGYAPEGTPVWLHSLVYNLSYMLPEAIITTIVSVVVVKLVLNKIK